MSPGLTDVYYELNIVSRAPTSSEATEAGNARPVAEGKPRGKFQVDFARSRVDKRYQRFHQLWNLWHGNSTHGGEALGASFPNLSTRSTNGAVAGPFEVEIVAYYPGKEL